MLPPGLGEVVFVLNPPVIASLVLKSNPPAPCGVPISGNSWNHSQPLAISDCLIRGSQLDSLLSRPFVFRGSLDFVLQLRAEEGMDTVLQSLVLLLG